MTSLTSATSDPVSGLADDLATLERDGVVGRKAALPRELVEQLREDMTEAFWEAIRRPGGAIGRGRRRWYVELHPEALSDFVTIATNPWITAMCERVLGPDWQIVEVGFDTPFQGAQDQPWHRDFPSPPESYEEHRITSLAFNISGVDVTEDMGPFEVAPGTQWDDGRSWNHGMFPDPSLWDRFTERAVRKYPRMGDISCRSALTV
ncbi:MAG: phytanoyl-CoA dioxygenase family protein, partial [Gluconacetobacter diazotrophicus]|nr:phytanoyl-CoA dioxygenase family protein [Gluconacetobacter diazotrophicus]